MSALAVSDLAPPARHLRFDRPDWERPSPPVRRVDGLAKRGRIPIPPGVAAYVRGQPHWDDVLHALLARLGTRDRTARRWDGARFDCARRLAGLLERDSANPLVSELLLLLFPPVPCPECGAPFIRDTRRRLYCGRRCGKRANNRAAYRREKARALRGR